MRQKAKNSSNGGANTILSPLVADKRRVVLAACLISIMAFMWIRVLCKDKPQAAAANSMTQQASPLSQGQPNSPLKISFVELPKVAGRHDVITRDFFTPGLWWKSIKGEQGGNLSDTNKVKFVSSRGDQGVIDVLAAKLKLEAIVTVKGKNLQAFINGKWLSVGDKLPIREGGRTFECEVVQIEENQVAIRCEQTEVTLTLNKVIED